MKILSIALKDLQIFLNDRGSVILLFLLPLVFILIFTALYSASQGSPTLDNRVGLVVVNLDQQGAAAQDLIDHLQVEGNLDAIPMSAAEAQDAYSKRTITRYLTIPENFSQSVASFQPASVHLAVFDMQNFTTQSVLLSLNGVANGLSLESSILASLEQMAQMNASASQEYQAFTAGRTKSQAQAQFDTSRDTPLVTIQQSLPSALQKQSETRINMVQISVPGFTILFAFLAAQVTARSIYDEKKTGSFRRLMAAPLSNTTILSGKLLPNFVIVLLQVLVIFAVSMFLMPLIGFDRLSLGNNPLALILAALATALCSTSLGIVIASLAHTESQIGGLSALALWVMGFIGGAIVPLSSINSPVFESLSRIVPQSWAVKAFQDVLVRGYGLAEVLPSLGALLLFSLAFFVFGVWRFDFN